MRCILAILALCLASSAVAAPEDVPAHSRLGTKLLNLALVPIEHEVGQPVKFDGSLTRMGEWAFFAGTIVDAEGDGIPAGRGQTANTAILWRRIAGKWQLIVWALGMTDAAYSVWTDRFGAPVGLLFPEGEGC